MIEHLRFSDLEKRRRFICRFPEETRTDERFSPPKWKSKASSRPYYKQSVDTIPLQLTLLWGLNSTILLEIGLFFNKEGRSGIYVKY